MFGNNFQADAKAKRLLACDVVGFGGAIEFQGLTWLVGCPVRTISPPDFPLTLSILNIWLFYEDLGFPGTFDGGFLRGILTDFDVE